MKGIIWARTLKNGIKQLEKIEKEYNLYSNIKTKQKRLSHPTIYVEFENGDFWRVCTSIASSKGRRANIGYIEHGIPEDFIEYVIKPCVSLSPYHALNYFYGDEE